MVPPIYLDAIIFSSLLTLLSIGLTLTYLTTKVPNFAHGTFAAIGAYISLTIVRLFRGTLYLNLYLPFLVCGIIALSQYRVILKPLMKKNVPIVGLMITTLAIDIFLLAVLNIYADYLTTIFKITSRSFNLKAFDLTVFGQKGILVFAPALTWTSVTMLHLLLTKTKFGISMRAAIENPDLASTMGINVDLVYNVSWFISGGLAGLSGALLPFWFLSNPDLGTKMIASIFASSIVGGLYSIYGAIIGGYLIGLIEILGTHFLAMKVGTWIIPYRPIMPVIAVAVTLLIAPKGILGVNWRYVFRKFSGKTD